MVRILAATCACDGEPKLIHTFTNGDEVWVCSCAAEELDIITECEMIADVGQIV